MLDNINFISENQENQPEPILTLEEMNDAIAVLFYFRESVGLEQGIVYRRRLDVP